MHAKKTGIYDDFQIMYCRSATITDANSLKKNCKICEVYENGTTSASSVYLLKTNYPIENKNLSPAIERVRSANFQLNGGTDVGRRCRRQIFHFININDDDMLPKKMVSLVGQPVLLVDDDMGNLCTLCAFALTNFSIYRMKNQIHCEGDGQ